MYTSLLDTQQLPADLAMALRKTFANNLRRARLAAGLSQEDLADIAGIDRTYVNALEQSRYAATVDVSDPIAAALMVIRSSLLEEEGNITPDIEDAS